MSEQLEACCKQRDCEIPDQHGHAYGWAYYGTPEQLREAWQASRAVRSAELRQVAFEKIHAYILEQTDE